MEERSGSRRGRRLAAALTLVAALGGLAAVSGTAGTSEHDWAPVPAAFRLADGSAGCALSSSGELACRAAAMSHSIVLEPDGGTRVVDETVRWSAETPVLLRVQSWWDGDFACRVARERIACSTASGGRIVVGSARIAATLPPAVS